MGRSSSKKARTVNVSKDRLDHLSRLLVDDLSEIVAGGVRSWLNERGVLLAQLLLNAEVLEVVGTRSERNPDRDCVRWGEQDGSVFVLEQKIPIKKARVRTKGGKSEVKLETYSELNNKKFLNEQAAAKLLSGVSTRRFPKTLEKTLRGKGIGRQTISDRAAAEMAEQLQSFQNRSLAGIEILALFIDGITLGEEIYVAAVGVDVNGKKYVLGFEAGSTESSAVCASLLSSLIEREILQPESRYLFVIDGGKGLIKAIKEMFGNRAKIQRCVEHKKRNVEKHLPKHMHQEFRHKFNAAFSQKSLKEAENAFDRLRRELVIERRQRAANSLVEGLPHLLTLHELGVKGMLRKSLCTTNIIESVFSAARYYTRNVKRWRGEEQMNRWIAAGLLEAESNLRRVPGFTQLNSLKKALKR